MDREGLPTAKSKTDLPALYSLEMGKVPGKMKIVGRFQTDKRHDPQSQLLRSSLSVVEEPICDKGNGRSTNGPLKAAKAPVSYDKTP